MLDRETYWKEYTYGTPIHVYAPRMKVIQTWVFRRCTLSHAHTVRRDHSQSNRDHEFVIIDTALYITFLKSSTFARFHVHTNANKKPQTTTSTSKPLSGTFHLAKLASTSGNGGTVFREFVKCCNANAIRLFYADILRNPPGAKIAKWIISVPYRRHFRLKISSSCRF